MNKGRRQNEPEPTWKKIVTKDRSQCGGRGGVSHLESYREHSADDSVGEAGANVGHHPVKVWRVAHTRIQQRGNTALRVSVCKMSNKKTLQTIKI